MLVPRADDRLHPRAKILDYWLVWMMSASAQRRTGRSGRREPGGVGVARWPVRQLTEVRPVHADRPDVPLAFLAAVCRGLGEREHVGVARPCRLRKLDVAPDESSQRVMCRDVQIRPRNVGPVGDMNEG